MEKPLRTFRERLRRWAHSPVTELNRTERRLRYVIDFVRNCIGELRYDRAPQMAAALTYHTLFSLMPMVVLMLVVTAAFVTEQQQDQMQETLIEMLLQPLYPEQVPDDEAGPAADAFELAMQDRDAILREQSERAFADALHYVIEELERVNLRGIGIVGILIFIFAATGLLGTIEKSFNTVYDVVKPRPWYLRLPLYYTTITLAPLMIIGGQLLQAWFVDLIDEGAWTAWAAGWLVVITPLFATWLVLSLVYILLPNTRVRIRPAMVGAAVAAVLWVVAIELFGLYVGNTGLMGLYGALALGPLFLLWLYITWLIVLFGLELAFVWQAAGGHSLKHVRLGQAQDRLVDRAWLLPLLAEIAERFEAGRTASVPHLATATGMPRGVVEKMTRALVNAGLVHRIEEPEKGDDRFVLARPADRITADEVLTVGEQLVKERNAKTGKAWTAVEKMNERARQLGHEMKLNDLLRNGAATAAEQPTQTATGTGSP